MKRSGISLSVFVVIGVVAASISLQIPGALATVPTSEYPPLEIFRDCEAARPTEPMAEGAIFQHYLAGGFAPMRNVISLYRSGEVVAESGWLSQEPEITYGRVDRGAIVRFARTLKGLHFERLNCWNFVDPLVCDLPSIYLRSRGISTHYYGFVEEMPGLLQATVEAWNELMDQVVWEEIPEIGFTPAD